ncbi:MAG: DUF3375 domain-containing protein [Verrucomicrobia bacterium]|nr:DUF3375 domain-containing protein [Verrucomicrobiota bacterium]
MTFDKIYQLLKTHRTVTLITADSAALIISFLFKSFKQNPNGFKTDTISEKDLTDQLSDYLYILNKDEVQFPRQPKQYLTDWTNAGYLRKYPIKNDEFLYELTAATENAFKWIDSLDKREFVGQESRLKNLFEGLKELSSKSKRDYATRIKELEEKKKQIEQEIEDVKHGKMDVLDDRQIKEQYFLIEETAKNLLADFRQVEQNFRELDRRFRQKIITTNLAKGKVLEDLFQQQANLLEEDQGKSFNAFWEFLLSQSKQEEFEKMLIEVLNLPAVQEVQRENFNIANVRNDLIEAGDRTKRSTNSLLEQLRKYLEHKSFTENKRIYDNIQEALKIISVNADKDFSKLDLLVLDNVIDIDLILGHGWDIRGFKPPEKIKFANNNPEEGKSTSDKDQLFEQFEISVAELKNNIKSALKNKTHITFTDFVKEFEIKKGVAEVVAYVEIASNEKSRHIVKEDEHDFIDIKNTKTDKNFKVKVPQIIFCK